MRALASDRMDRFLDEVGSSFDWIRLDAPPVALIADAGVLARLTRAVIVVIRAGSTPHSLVEKVVAGLGRENIIGTVLNHVEEDATQWSAYYSSSDRPREPVHRSQRTSPCRMKYKRSSSFSPSNGSDSSCVNDSLRDRPAA